jgi:outer membrane lipoprotein-sorting protein
MKTIRTRLLYLVVGLTFGQLVIGAKPVAAQGDCQLVLNAASKVFDVAAHVYVTMNMGGTTQTGETIYVAGAIYTKLGGKWGPTPMSMQEMKELDQKNRQTNKTTCRFLKDESVNGEMAAVYSMHNEGPQGKSDSQIWISKAKGLPLRSETDMGDKNLVSMRYEYANVKPPM